MNFVYLMLFLLLFCVFPLAYGTEPLLPKALPKTKDLFSDKNKAVIETTSGSLVGEQQQEEEKIDINQNYKLVAIYLIDSQPRALIKNLLIPEEGAMEYGVGDFLDELQTFSIYKVSFNPTARVELIDQDGVSYLIKPSGFDVKNLAGSPKGSFSSSMSVPSYFSAGGYKAKSKKSKVAVSAPGESPSSTISDKPSDTTIKSREAVVEQLPQQEQPQQQPAPQVTPSQSLQAVTTGASQTNSQEAAPKSGSAAETSNRPASPPAQPSSGDTLDLSRPSNPFQ